MSVIEVGISGWTYQGWRGSFYPTKLPQHEELTFASRELPSIEINGTFYRLQRPSTYKHWYEVTPKNFVFSIKANRYITHIKRLKEPKIPIANFIASGPLALREKLGPLLWQFPPNMAFDPDRLEKFLALLPHDFEGAARLGRKSELPKERIYLKVKDNFRVRHAIEIRNNSFLNPLFVELLKQHNVAIVFAETAGKWPYLEDITADFIYVRLHGGSVLYVSGYNDETLNFWSNRIKRWKRGLEASDRLTISEKKAEIMGRDVYVYFDNDANARAPVDAKCLISKLGLQNFRGHRKELR